MKKVFFAFMLVLLFNSVYYAQSFYDVDSIPIYVEKFPLDDINQPFSYHLKTVDSVFLPGYSLDGLSDTFRIEEHRGIIRKKPWIILHIFPLRKTYDGKVQKLVKYTIEYKKGPCPFSLKKTKNYVSESVLATGTWYKISTKDGGIYRITYQDLVNWGIDPATIDPRNIRLYGNGPRMLPEKAGAYPYDDLVENPIYVYGENDGKFDPGDFILFFAEGMSYWKHGGGRNFSHETNLYSQQAYYYLTFDKGTGSRIQTLPVISATPTRSVDVFYDFSMHEINQYNLIKSGKNWFGDVFEYPTFSKNFSFSFPNIIIDSLAQVKVVLAARSTTSSQARISVGTDQSVLSFSPVGDYTTDYAKLGTGTLSFYPSSSILNVQIQYNNGGNQQAQAWLDYIEVFAWRRLQMNGHQMVFRHPDVVGSGEIVEYKLQAPANVTVWDISDPLHPWIVQGTWNNGIYIFLVHNDSLKTFLAFDGVEFHTPSFVGKVANQNLHGVPQVDYVIVAHPDFLSQAQQLANYHFLQDGLSYVVVTPQMIYEEFSSGKQDISAIRNFLKMLYDRAQSEDEMPKYLLLFGDASYDYLNRIANNTNYVPTFQTQNSLSPTLSYLTDDFFGLLDDGEGEDAQGALDIGIGRFPVKTVTEAQDVVNKTIRYIQHEKINSNQNACISGDCKISNLAGWRNWILFVCDDGDGNLHFNQSERLANYVDTTVKFLNIDKVYLPAYPQITTSGGERSPETNEAIRQRVEKGALIVNYTGHGGEVGWALERILDVTTIQQFTNACNLPVFITATCEFSRFDDPDRTSAGEYLFLNPHGGAAALFTTTRLAFSSFNEALNKSFYKKAFQYNNGKYPAFGDIMAFCKNDNGSSQPLKNFSLLGDPAASLAIPKHKIVVTAINDHDTLVQNDTIKAMSFVSLKGKIVTNEGNDLPNFNGTLYVTVFDKPSILYTFSGEGNDYLDSFVLQKNILYKGKVSVHGGVFELKFFVPKDIQYQYGHGRISFYAEDGQAQDATGWFENFILDGSTDSLFSDAEGPAIQLYMNDTLFRDGGVTDENPTLLAYLSDEHGINTTGNGVGHDLVAYLDEDRSHPNVLNDYFEADVNSFTSGTVRYSFRSLSPGWHTLHLRAWDNLNNSSEKTLAFKVVSRNNFVISSFYTYPNPMETFTNFVFEHNLSCCYFDARLNIYDIFGRLVKSLTGTFPVSGYRTVIWTWDGTSDEGMPMPPGIYVGQLILISSDGKVATKSLKILKTH